ncbi:MAG: shikimate kinase [Terriglobales bacterium]
MRAVFLVGFMGAGKTSVGVALARRLGWRFVDLDERVEKRERRKIAEIFAESGEAAFRRAEAAALKDLLDESHSRPLVVALGGGAFVQPENARLLKTRGGPVVFLDAPVEELRRRCGPKAATRPLFANENQFRQLYESRRSSYMQADICVDTTGHSVEQTAAEVAQRLGLDEQHESSRSGKK